MGLYDDFRITSGPFAGDRYQTKDLDRAMRTYRVGESAVLEVLTVHWEERPLTDERRAELRARVEERGEGVATFHDRHALKEGVESVETHRTWDPATYTGTAVVYRYDPETDRSFDLVLEFQAGVLVSLRQGEEGTGRERWEVSPVGPSHPPAHEGPVTVVVGPTAEEIAAAFPSAHLF